MSSRVVLYARVSTDGQTVENQLKDLREVSERSGWDVIDVVIDKGVSGSKGKEERAGFNQLHKMVNRREVDLIACWSVDRLGRSLQDLITFLSEVHSKDVNLYLHQQGIDTTTPAGKAMFQMMGVFAEFERSMIQERVKSGLKRARLAGKTLGRPCINEAKKEEILKLRNLGWGKRKIAAELKTGVGTVSRIINKNSHTIRG